MGKILPNYETLWLMTQEMYEGLRNNDWDGVILAREKRQKVLDRLSRSGSNGSHPEDVDEEGTVFLMKRILTLNGHLKDMVKERMTEMEKSFQAEKQMIKAYGVYSEE